MDLRRRLGMVPGTLTTASRIVVCEAAGTRVGLVVDGVSEVLMVSDDAVEQTPEVASGYDASCATRNGLVWTERAAECRGNSAGGLARAVGGRPAARPRGAPADP